MILEKLSQYYARANLAPVGWEKKEIPFFIVIDENGKFIRLENRTDSKNPRGLPILVPQSEIRSGKNAWQKPNFLWDHHGFILGEPKQKPNGEIDPTDSLEKATNQFRAFKKKISDTLEKYPDLPELKAINSFYINGEYIKIKDDPVFKEIFKIPGANLTFVLTNQVSPIVNSSRIVDLVTNSTKTQVNSDDATSVEDDESHIGSCLVTGLKTEITRLHPKIKGVSDKPSPLSAANTNEFPAYSSYRKSQGFNFPIGKAATFEYSTALNNLLARDSRQRVLIGDASTVFWAEEDHDLEHALPDLFGEPPKDDPNRGTNAVKVVVQAARSGKFSVGSNDARFHILGLAPNAGRIAVRFWETATAFDLSKRVAQHFTDLEIVRAPHDPEYLSLFRLLTALAIQGKADNIPPNLGGEVMRAILNGTPYPAGFLNLAIQRSKAEQQPSYARIAAIKASINRIIRRNNLNSSQKEREFQVMLDTTNHNPAYLLGRLFATLEKIQEEANPGTNATIRDRYYSAASSTPVVVFTTLLRLKNHHLGKLHKGRAVQLEKLIAEIMSDLSDFPRILTLQEQGRFAIGYYHQRQNFFNKPQSSTEEVTQ